MASARNRHMRSALLLGLAAGMRTFSAPAALALRGGPLNGPRRVLLLAAVCEDGLAISLATLGAARSSRRTSGASQLTS